MSRVSMSSFSSSTSSSSSSGSSVTRNAVIATAASAVVGGLAYLAYKYSKSPKASSSSCCASKTPSSSSSSTSSSKRRAVLIVDPISTGANLSDYVIRQGWPVVRVFSRQMPDSVTGMILPGLRSDYVATITHGTDLTVTLNAIHALPYTPYAILCGSELGTELTDILAEQLHLLGNGTSLSDARRDKYLMGETVRAAGVRAVRQARVQTWDEVEEFLKRLDPHPFKVVIKPIRSAGSDSVYLCESKDDLKAKFDHILGTHNAIGILNSALVVQEYLEGTEYVVDSVSKNGKHKIVAIWAYDKRTNNGVAFVYYGMQAIDGTGPIARQLSSYQRQVLDALQIKNGCGHGEVILTPTGPCLVEVGARPHGGEGTFMPMGDAVYGTNQVSAYASSLLDEKAWNAIPDDVGKWNKFSLKVDLVCNVSGVLASVEHFDKIRALASYLEEDTIPKPGDTVHVTIDCFTQVGSVTLVHDSQEQVLRDHELVREYEKTMFIVKS